MMVRRAFVALLMLGACADFPVFEHEERRGLSGDAPLPRILPIEGLLVQALGPLPGRPTLTPLADVADPLAARVARLKARAAILRGAPVDADTRGRLAGQ